MKHEQQLWNATILLRLQNTGRHSFGGGKCGIIFVPKI